MRILRTDDRDLDPISLVCLDRDAAIKDAAALSDAQLLAQVKAGSGEAFEALVVRHIPLVLFCIRKYAKVPHALKADFFQNGVIGLMRAIRAYDGKRGAFSTLAVRCIIQQFYLFDSPNPLTISRGFDIRRKVYAAMEEVGDDSGSEESMQRIAKAAGLSAETVTKFLRTEDYVDDENENAIEDLPADSREEQTWAAIGAFRDGIEELLDDLTPRQAYVVRCYYGLGNHEPRNLREIAKTLCVTHQRATQIHDKAIRRLAHPSRSRRLKKYWEAIREP